MIHDAVEGRGEQELASCAAYGMPFCIGQLCDAWMRWQTASLPDRRSRGDAKAGISSRGDDDDRLIPDREHCRASFSTVITISCLGG